MIETEGKESKSVAMEDIQVGNFRGGKSMLGGDWATYVLFSTALYMIYIRK